MSAPTYLTDRVTCPGCGGLMWKVQQDCAPCGLVQETKCRSCGALLRVRFGRAIDILAPGKRNFIPSSLLRDSIGL